MDTHMLVRLVLGPLIMVVALAVAGRRVFFLYRLVSAGQPSPGRLDNAPRRLVAQLTEVFGQKKLLQWSVPGLAHFFVFWGFIILTFTIIEAIGALFQEDFAIPFIGWLLWATVVMATFGAVLRTRFGQTPVLVTVAAYPPPPMPPPPPPYAGGVGT